MPVNRQNYILNCQTILWALVALSVFQFGGRAGAAQFWTAEYLTDNSKSNVLRSAPAYDDAGHIVALWEVDDLTTLPAVWMGRSADDGLNYSITPLRDSVPAGVSEITPVVATDKSGNWVSVWASDDSLGSSIGSDFDILFSRSTDAGVTWSAPLALNSTAVSDAGFDTSPTLALDNAGNCIAAWVSDNDPTNSASTSEQTSVWISRSSNAGLTWSTAEPLNPDSGVSLFEPQIKSNGEASFGFVWTARTGSATGAEVWFAHSDNAGASWTVSPAAINDSADSLPSTGAFQPVLAGDASGRWMVGWITATASDYAPATTSYVRCSPDNGASWLTKIELGYYMAISLYTDNAGTWCLGGQLGYTQQADIQVSRDFGSSWSLAAKFPSARPPYVPGAPDPMESVPFTWRRADNSWIALYGCDPHYAWPIPKFEIRQATSVIPPLPPENATWSAAESFTPSSLIYGQSPKIETDSWGNWIAVYSTPGSGGSNDSEIAFVRSTDGGRNWTAPQFVNSDWSTDTVDDSAPVIAVSNNKFTICVWKRGDEIWMARSADSGVSWSAAMQVQIPGEGILEGTSPGIAALGLHKWILTWFDGAVYSSLSDDDGHTWAEPVLVQGGYTLNHCGNTSPCSNHSFRDPRVYSAPGNPNVFVGFEHHWVEQPNGYSGLSYSYTQTDGQLSPDGGMTYPGNIFISPLIGPSFTGTNEMANDGRHNWLAARRTMDESGNDPQWKISFGASGDNGESFVYEDIPAVDGREHLWGKVAMSHTGKWLRLWAGEQGDGLADSSTNIIISESTDAGASWTAPTHLNTDTAAGADSPIDLNVRGGIDGNFVAVWEAKLPNGESTIWFARQNLYEEAAARDWQLFY